MGNQTKDDELYREMCRVVGKVVLEMRDLGQEPKHIVIAGVLRTTLAKEGANKRGNSSRLTQSFHFFMFEPIFSPVNALNQPI
ncbi:fumarate hydratase FumD [Escherichia coli]|uniref:fumarate hydratase FumD n=1 Tax=Escherichia coli TaxID=562 RepID=UPI0030C87FC0